MKKLLVLEVISFILFASGFLGLLEWFLSGNVTRANVIQWIIQVIIFLPLSIYLDKRRDAMTAKKKTK